jgi:hypothetical protein
MPRPAYQNTFRPNTEIGAGLANLTAALFPSRATAQELAEAEAKRALYAAQTEAGLANAGESTEKTRGFKIQNDAALLEPDTSRRATLFQTDAKQLEEARLAGIEVDVQNKILKAETPQEQERLTNIYLQMKRAAGAKDRYSMNANNVVLDQNTGGALNELNDLNQSKAMYGNDGEAVGLSRIGVNNSTIRLNNAKVGTESAQADKYRKDAAGTSSLVETYTGVDANGNPTFKLVPKDVNAVITKPPASKAGIKSFSIKDMNDVRNELNSNLGIYFDKNGNPTDDSQLPLDSETETMLVQEVMNEAQQTGNIPQALTSVVARLTGNGSNLVNSNEGAMRTTIDPFGIVPVPWKDPVAKKRGLPKKQQPVKPKQAPAIPDGWSVSEIQ